MSRRAGGPNDDWSHAVEQRGLASLWQVVRAHKPAVLAQVRAVLDECRALISRTPSGVAEGGSLRASVSPAQANGVAQAPPGGAGTAQELEAIFVMFGHCAVGDLTELSARVAAYGARCANCQVSLSAMSQLIEQARSRAATLLVSVAHADPAQLEAALGALLALFDRAHQTITGQHFAQLEQRLAEERRSAGEALTRFNRLTESGLLGTLVCDIFGHITDVNDTLLTMLGYTRDEFLAGEVTWTELTPPEWRHLDDRAVEQLMANGRSELWEKEYFRKDGTRLPILVGVAQLLEDTDTVAFILDISERKRAEAMRLRSMELETENQRIHEASRLKSEFLANMSHELRTPLNSIIGFADLLYDGEIALDSPQYREFIGDILKSGRHLLQLINDVLDLAKVEAGHMTFRPERLELSTVFGEVVDVLRSISTANQITVVYAVDPEVTSVFADPARLKQVLYNYLSNALKFTPPSGRVTLRALPAGEQHFRIEVEDTGVGIQPSDLGRLFIEFQQLEPGATKRHAGTGLGLALTKRIVEAQGGTVGVRSTPGVGSTFWATFRYVQPAPREHASIVPERFDGAPLLLVVEDDPSEGQLLAQMLNRARYSVEIAHTAQQAIEACEQRTFDAITLDLLLPDGNGLQVLQAIRLGMRNRSTPVLVVSLVAEKNVIHGFMVHDYLSKPLESERLLGSLARAGVVPETHGSILVVDDDPSALKLIQMTLGKLGFSVDCYLDAESALRSVGEKQHVAVILDLLMPGMDGFEFLTRFRANPEFARIPVLVWTTKDLTAEDTERLRHHAQAVFAKGSGRPLSLADQLKSILKRRAAEQPDTPARTT